MPKHTKAEQEKRQRERQQAIMDLFKDKPIPGGPSTSAFDKVIKALRGVITQRNGKKKQK